MAVALATAGCGPAPPADPTPEVVLDAVSDFALAFVEREVARVDFGSETSIPHLVSGFGYGQPSADGWIWAVGERSELVFYANSSSARRLTLRCWPFHFAGAPTQSIAVAVNGQPIASIELQVGRREYAVDVPSEALRIGRNRITFTYAYARAPRDVNENARDARPLSVAWDWIDLGGRSAAGPPRVILSDPSGAIELPTATRLDYFVRLPAEATFEVAAVRGAGGYLVVELEGDQSEVVTTRLGLGDNVQRIPLRVRSVASDLAGATRIARLSFRVEPAAPGNQAGSLTLVAPRVVAPVHSVRASVAAARARAATTMVHRERRPNVLIYLVDTLRADNLGVYGYTRTTSPRLDAFAGDATLYLNGRANTSWTRPAVASIFTGLTPWRHGVNTVRDGLPGKLSTLAELLNAAGYETAAFITNGNVSSDFGFAQGFETFKTLAEDLNRRGVHADSKTLRELAWSWLESRADDRPFFLYMHATDPHAPYAPRADERARLAPEVDDLALETLDLMRDLAKLDAPPPAGTQAGLLALYDAEIASMDAEFGVLLDGLRERPGLLDDTLVIFTSDHGEEFFEHGWWQHGKTLYGEQLRIPLIIRYPDGVGAGQRVEGVAQQIDLLPTILAAVGLPVPGSLEGRSLLEDQGGRERGAVALLNRDGRHLESISLGGMKLIQYHSYAHPLGLQPPTQLFDVVNDPWERRNLSQERPVLVGYLRSELRRATLRADEGAVADSIEIDPETEATLRALGYID